MNWNYWAKKAYTDAYNAGWYTDINTGKPKDKKFTHVLALVHSEISEALEGWRKDLMDEKLPDVHNAVVEIADTIIRLMDYAGKENLNLDHNWKEAEKKTEDFGDYVSELHNLVYKLSQTKTKGEKEPAVWEIVKHCEYACKRYYPEYDLWNAVEEKMAFNQKRLDHKIENRKKENGKKI